jgi:hypothetical protein
MHEWGNSVFAEKHFLVHFHCQRVVQLAHKKEKIFPSSYEARSNTAVYAYMHANIMCTHCHKLQIINAISLYDIRFNNTEMCYKIWLWNIYLKVHKTHYQNKFIDVMKDLLEENITNLIIYSWSFNMNIYQNIILICA